MCVGLDFRVSTVFELIEFVTVVDDAIAVVAAVVVVVDDLLHWTRIP